MTELEPGKQLASYPLSELVFIDCLLSLFILIFSLPRSLFSMLYEHTRTFVYLAHMLLVKFCMCKRTYSFYSF